MGRTTFQGPLRTHGGSKTQTARSGPAQGPIDILPLITATQYQLGFPIGRTMEVGDEYIFGIMPGGRLLMGDTLTWAVTIGAGAIVDVWIEAVETDIQFPGRTVIATDMPADTRDPFTTVIPKYSMLNYASYVGITAKSVIDTTASGLPSILLWEQWLVEPSNLEPFPDRIST